MSRLFFGIKTKGESMKETSTETEEWCTVSGASEVLKRCEGMMRIYANSRQLPCVRTGTGLRLFRKSDLETFAREHLRAEEVIE
jgi:hypothetical protein